MRHRLLSLLARDPSLIKPAVSLPLTFVVSATRMVVRLCTTRCIFISFWLELTSLGMASHGPQKLRHSPVSLVSNGLRYTVVSIGLQYAIAKSEPQITLRYVPQPADVLAGS